MKSIQSLLLVGFLMLAKANAAGIYTLAAYYTKYDETAVCSGGDAADMEKATVMGFFNSGLIDDKSRGKWKEWDRGVPAEEKNPGKGGNNKERHLCDSFCQFLCEASGGRNKWCDCCSCCGNGRRRLRSLATVRIANDSPEELVKLEQKVATNIENELMAKKNKVSCLLYEEVVTDPEDGAILSGGYEVEVEIVPASVEDIEAFESNRKAIRQKIRAAFQKKLQAERDQLQAHRADLRELRTKIRAAKKATKQNIKNIKGEWKATAKQFRKGNEHALQELRLGDEESGGHQNQ